MSKVTEIQALPREPRGKGGARTVRREGLVPGVIYGDNKPPVHFKLDPRILVAEMNRSGFKAHQFDVTVDGATHRVLAQDVQTHPVKDYPTHVDFLRISREHEMTVEVPVRFINDTASPGLKRGGVLNIVRHDVEVVCKADDIPENLVVDLTGTEINDSIHISAVTLPPGVRPAITDRDFTIATIAAPSGMKSEAAGDEADGD